MIQARNTANLLCNLELNMIKLTPIRLALIVTYTASLITVLLDLFVFRPF